MKTFCLLISVLFQGEEYNFWNMNDIHVYMLRKNLNFRINDDFYVQFLSNDDHASFPIYSLETHCFAYVLDYVLNMWRYMKVLCLCSRFVLLAHQGNVQFKRSIFLHHLYILLYERQYGCMLNQHQQ